MHSHSGDNLHGRNICNVSSSAVACVTVWYGASVMLLPFHPESGEIPTCFIACRVRSQLQVQHVLASGASDPCASSQL